MKLSSAKCPVLLIPPTRASEKILPPNMLTYCAKLFNLIPMGVCVGNYTAHLHKPFTNNSMSCLIFEVQVALGEKKCTKKCPVLPQ